MASIVAAVVVCLGGTGRAKAADKVDKALDRQVSVSWKSLEVRLCLADLAKQAKLKVEIDPRLPETIGQTPVNYEAKRAPARVALGHALRAAGLRYAVTDEGIYVSTPNLLARKIVYSTEEDLPESEPMDLGQALDVLSRPEREREEAFGLGDPAYTVDCRPHRLQERPRYNPETGLTDYPAPPIWMLGDDDVNTAYFRYSRHPYFPTPPEIVLQGGQTGSGDQLLAQLVRLLREDPVLFRRLVKALEKGSD